MMCIAYSLHMNTVCCRRHSICCGNKPSASSIAAPVLFSVRSAESHVGRQQQPLSVTVNSRGCVTHPATSIGRPRPAVSAAAGRSHCRPITDSGRYVTGHNPADSGLGDPRMHLVKNHPRSHGAARPSHAADGRSSVVCDGNDGPAVCCHRPVAHRWPVTDDQTCFCRCCEARTPQVTISDGPGARNADHSATDADSAITTMSWHRHNRATAKNAPAAPSLT